PDPLPRAGGAGHGALALPDRALRARAGAGGGGGPRAGSGRLPGRGGRGRRRPVPSRPDGRSGPAAGGGAGGGDLALVPRPAAGEGRPGARRRGGGRGPGPRARRDPGGAGALPVGLARPRREVPAGKKAQLFRRVLAPATDAQAEEWRRRRQREERAIESCRLRAREKGLRLKIIDVEIEPDGSRIVVFFASEERVDFRDLVRELAREFRARIEMRQIGARDTTKVLDGIGPCGRQLCCSSYLRKFEPISVKMAKTQDLPLTDNRLLGNCGRLKCCLLYEFSTYQELRARLPKVNT